MITGIVFDLDGTLLDSALDFEAMRCEMQLPSGLPILEAIEALPPHERNQRWEILHRHERVGAAKATPIPGIHDFLQHIGQTGWRCGIATRNSGLIARQMVRQLPLHFDPIITRDDGAVKPDPWPLQHICRHWQTEPQRVVMIGDHEFDIDCGVAAGTKTVFYSAGKERHELTTPTSADFVLPDFRRFADLLAWLNGTSQT